MTRPLCISADSHVVEPPELFAPLQKRFGDQAPRIRFFEDRGPQLDLGNGKLGLGIAGFLMANMDFSQSETRDVAKKGYELARPGVYDVKARIADQDQDGVDAEVLYPSILFNVYQVENPEIIKAAFVAYNDWTAAYCAEAPRRLFPLACIQLYDLDAAITEMERARRLGHVGVCIPATAPPDRPYTDRWYDKFWAAAQDLHMPCTMHIFTGATENHGLPNRHAGYALAFAGVMFTIADLIFSGVCERFPALRFVPTEFETGWTAIMLKRLDWSYIRRGGPQTHDIPMLPSAYWKRNFLVTFEDDDIGIKTRDVIGTQTLMWGNDYPHGDSVFPQSQKVLERILEVCTPAERYEMTAKNVVQLYNLPFEI